MIQLELQTEVIGANLLAFQSSNNPSVFSSKDAQFESPETAVSGGGKLNIPSRRNRNRPASRVHDIEFATEISTSLLAQVRQLQNLLSERDEALKNANLEKSRLELEAEGFAQRIHILDESEQRYKDENWTLELRNQDLYNQIRDLTEREERLSSNLKLLEARQTGLQKEVDEVRAANTRLLEEQLSTQKKHDAEVHALRRNVNASETERTALQKKLQEVTGQNQELVRAVAMKFREQDDSPGHRGGDNLSGGEGGDLSDSTPENSPPPSPGSLRPTPLRNKNLESETLKSSLHHAQRMIQNLKNTIHREKSEKMELKRMLQEARDEVESRRKEPSTPGGALGSSSSTNLRRPKSKSIVFKKPPMSLLGKGRRAETEIEEVREHDPLGDADWEDHPGDGTHGNGSVRGTDRKLTQNAGSGPPPAKMLKTSHGRSRVEGGHFSRPSKQTRRIEDENISPRHVPARLPPLQTTMTTPTKKTRPTVVVPSTATTETDTDAFETAHERDTTTETEGFHTGLEEFDNSSDTIGAGTDTETELTPSRAASKQKRGLARPFSMKTLRQANPRTPLRNKMAQQGSRDSFVSTASTSDDEGELRLVERSRFPSQQYHTDAPTGLSFGAGLASGFGMGSSLEQQNQLHQLQQQHLTQHQMQNGQNPPRYRLRLSRSRRASSKPSLYGGSDLSTSTSMNFPDNSTITSTSIQNSPASSLMHMSRNRTGSVSTLGGPNGSAPGQSLFAELDEDDFEGNGSGSGSDDPDAAYRVSSPVAANMGMDMGAGMQSVPSTPVMRNITPASRQSVYGSGYPYAYSVAGAQGNRLRKVVEGVPMVDQETMTVDIPLEEMQEVQEIVEREVEKRKVIWNLQREDKEGVETVPVQRTAQRAELIVQKAAEGRSVETTPVAKVRVYKLTASGIISEVQSVPSPRVAASLSYASGLDCVETKPVKKQSIELTHLPATAANVVETKPIPRAPSTLTAGAVTNFAETKPVFKSTIPLLTSTHEFASTEPVERMIYHPDLVPAEKSFVHTFPVEKQSPTLSHAKKTHEETAPLARQHAPLAIARVHKDGHVSTEPVTRESEGAPMCLSQIESQSTAPVEAKSVIPLDVNPVGGLVRSEVNSAETKPRPGSAPSLHLLNGALGAVAGATGALAGARALTGQDESAHAAPRFNFTHSGTSQYASTDPIDVRSSEAATARLQPNYTTTSSVSSVETSPVTTATPKVEYAHLSPSQLSYSETRPIPKEDYTDSPELGASSTISAVETVPVERKARLDSAQLSFSSTQGIETTPIRKTEYTPTLAPSGVQEAVQTPPTEKKHRTLELSASGVESVGTTPVSTTHPISKYVNSSVSSVGTEPVEAKIDTPAYTTSDVTIIETAPIAVVKSAIALEKSDAHNFAETLPLPPAVAEPTFKICKSELQYAETTPSIPASAVSVPAEKGIILGFSGVTSAHTKPSKPSHRASEKPLAHLRRSEIQSQGTEVLSPLPLRPKNANALGTSVILSEETIPAPAEKEYGGLFRTTSAAAGATALGLGLNLHEPTLNDESTSRPVTAMRDADTRMEGRFELPNMANVGAEARASGVNVPLRDIETSENATQTIVTSQLIDQLLIERHNSRSASTSMAGTPSTSTPALASTPFGLTVPEEDDESTHTTPKAKSIRSRANSGISENSSRTHRPYGSLATEQSMLSSNSAAVTQPEYKAYSSQLSPQLQPQQQFGTALVGPTYRLSERPRTPSSQSQQFPQQQQQQQQYGTAIIYPTYRIGEGPRTPVEQTNRRHPHTPSTIRRESHPSHRSSLSSFGSVDHKAEGVIQSHGGYTFEFGTDPRMIQAITQTMIGEWLWKYTRNLGRTGLSSTRHQRYVWVHPYTRTLYWSTHDPQADGSQHNSKSIPIESVREVEDDNPYPPGICSKSLEIVTPARTVKFTAQTSQRHETWYNALRYLLLRTAPEDENGHDQTEQTALDMNTINPTLRSPARTQHNLRMSASSRNIRRSNSRTGTPTSRRTNSVRASSSIRAPSLLSHPDANSLRAKRNTSTSRLSSLFHQHTHTHAGKAGSFRTRRVRARPSTADMANPHSMSAETQARPSMDASMHSSHEYPASLLSAADLEGLENVRACCGGKHDVGSLCRPRHDRRSSDGR